LLRARSSDCQREHNRQDRYSDHHPPFRAFGPSNLAN